MRLGDMIAKVIGFLKRPCIHSWGDETYLGETGEMCFSINCARPEIKIGYTCKKCGARKEEFFMSGNPLKAVDLSPDIAARCLDHMRRNRP